jgi:hypothetical protein
MGYAIFAAVIIGVLSAIVYAIQDGPKRRIERDGDEDA